MWNWLLSPKIKIFFCQLCNGCVPTRLNLQARRVDCSGFCGLCGKAEESTLHLFILCDAAKEAWEIANWTWINPGAREFLEQLELEFNSEERRIGKVNLGMLGYLV
ncbi:unnamed protein product [Cuscuta europaea]|uniref:Reverse transcriptase zinc-binding domain-containing protein n=1 Tax=Cuscuta europaea TaxID=41803 RepID=A0A9P1ECM8_CUSEU|nr:unnamed protein product [Cuscuta europaea]